LNSKALKVFFIYTIILAVFVVLSISTIYILKSVKIYYYILKLYAVVEYCLFAQFLFNIYTNTLAKKIILYSTIPFILYCVINFVVDKSSFSNTPSLIEFIAFIIFIIYFFYEKMKTVVQFPVYQSITFWICVGLFLYFTGNFFFFLFINSSTDPIFIAQMKNIYFFVTISKNILLSVAFFANENPEKTNDEIRLPNELYLDDFTLTNLKK
jgi:hypothetical protein